MSKKQTPVKKQPTAKRRDDLFKRQGNQPQAKSPILSRRPPRQPGR